jgi:hypothetical protein
MICKYHSDRASKLMSQRHSIDRAYIRPCSTSLLNRVSRATGDFKKLEKLLQLARKTHNKRYPSIGVGAFFFISFVLYLANPLHRHGTLPFSAHIDTHGNSFALFWRLGTHSRQVSTINYQQQEKSNKNYLSNLLLHHNFRPSFCENWKLTTTKSSPQAYRFLFRRSWSTLGWMPELEQSSIAKDGRDIGGLDNGGRVVVRTVDR